MQLQNPVNSDTSKIVRQELALNLLLGSGLDIDHFIAARSLSIYDATHLSHRPFGHSLLFMILFMVNQIILYHRRFFHNIPFISIGCRIFTQW